MLEVNKFAQTSADESVKQRRLAWRCRRGMLELDIVLQRFVASQFSTLTEIEMQQLDNLLELPDNDIWTLINNQDLTNNNNQFEKLILKLKPAMVFDAVN